MEEAAESTLRESSGPLHSWVWCFWTPRAQGSKDVEVLFSPTGLMPHHRTRSQRTRNATSFHLNLNHHALPSPKKQRRPFRAILDDVSKGTCRWRHILGSALKSFPKRHNLHSSHSDTKPQGSSLTGTRLIHPLAGGSDKGAAPGTHAAAGAAARPTTDSSRGTSPLHAPGPAVSIHLHTGLQNVSCAGRKVVNVLSSASHVSQHMIFRLRLHTSMSP